MPSKTSSLDTGCRNLFAIRKSLLALATLSTAISPAIAAPQTSGTAATSGSTPAVVSGSTEKAFTLGTVTVYGKEPDVAAQLETQTTAEKIQLLEKKTVNQALATQPGISTAVVGARNEATVYVRGFNRLQVPIFIDGVPAYVPYDGYVDLNRFTTFDVGTISVAKGYSSVLYGPNTMGGAINIISRQPSRPLEGDITLGAFTGDGYETALNIGSKQDKFYFQLGASYITQDHFELSDDFVPTKAEDGGTRENSFYTDWKLSGKLAFTPNATDEYALGFVHQEGEKATPPYAGTDPTQWIRYWQWPKWNKDTVYFVSTTQLGEASYIKPRIYFDQYENALDQYSDATYSKLLTGSSGPSRYEDYTWGTSVELGTELIPMNTLKGAAHYKLDHHDEQIVHYPSYVDEDETYSFALEDTFHVTKSLDIQAGFSYDIRNTLQAEDTNLYGAPFPTNDFSKFNPEAGIFYKLTDTDTVHFTIAQKSRFPTIKERYSYGLGKALANPDLQPETAIHYELGYEGQPLKGLTVRANAFYSSIEDAIQSVSNVAYINKKWVSQNQNLGEAETFGGELGLDYAFGDWLTVGNSVSYVWKRNLTNPAIHFTDVPPWSGFAYADIRPISKVSLIPSLQYSSWRYSYSDGRTLDSFAVPNFKVSYRITNDLTFSVGVNNVFDKNYALQDGYYEAGRTYFTNLRYTF